MAQLLWLQCPRCEMGLRVLHENEMRWPRQRLARGGTRYFGCYDPPPDGAADYTTLGGANCVMVSGEASLELCSAPLTQQYTGALDSGKLFLTPPAWSGVIPSSVAHPFPHQTVSSVKTGTLSYLPWHPQAQLTSPGPAQSLVPSAADASSHLLISGIASSRSHN